MAMLGIDYGAKKIGLAVSNESNSMALPLEVLFNTGHQVVLDRIKSICHDHQVETIVVGVPVSLKAEKRETFWRQKDLQNQQMREVLNFITWLQESIGLPIEVEDERLSTKQAKALGTKGHDDAVAAMLILQTYLDKHFKSQK